jgi:thiol:disulfide interchange protein DsbD
MEVKPGWHIYWKNPGEAGLPTSVRFDAPDGFEVGDLVWPTPKRFSQPGDILGYGYEEVALFVSRIQAPRDLKIGTDVTIVAEVGWLSCEKVCIPGKSKLSLTLPVRPQVEQGNEALFAEWSRKAPRDIDDAKTSAAIQVLSGSAAKENLPQRFDIAISWRASVSDVEWFPAPGDEIDISDTTVRSDGMHTRITFAVQLLGGVGVPPDAFESVVAFTDASGARSALRVPVPIRRH